MESVFVFKQRQQRFTQEQNDTLSNHLKKDVLNIINVTKFKDNMNSSQKQLNNDLKEMKKSSVLMLLKLFSLVK